MRTALWFLVVGASLSLVARSVAQDSSKTDAAKLQGAWTIVSVEVEGKPLGMEKLNDARLTVKGRHYSFRLEGIELELTCALDASKAPKGIDLTIVDGADKGKMYRGIYKFEQDRYTICRSFMPEMERPTTFATRADSGLMKVVWKRAAAQVSK